MSAFWHRMPASTEQQEESFIEIIDIKKNTHKTAEQAKKDVKRLNKLLKANGITLRIHIATSGEHNGK